MPTSNNKITPNEKFELMDKIKCIGEILKQHMDVEPVTGDIVNAYKAQKALYDIILNLDC